MADKVVPKKTVRKTVRKTTTRKAPTRALRSSAPSSKNNLPILIGVGVFILVLGVSIAIGYSDRGSINVSGVITEKKKTGTEEEKAAIRNIPVQQAKSATPDGGLVPTTDVDTSVTQKKEKESETASSTDASATSTDETASSTTELSVESSDTSSSTEEAQ